MRGLGQSSVGRVLAQHAWNTGINLGTVPTKVDGTCWQRQEEQGQLWLYSDCEVNPDDMRDYQTHKTRITYVDSKLQVPEYLHLYLLLRCCSPKTFPVALFIQTREWGQGEGTGLGCSIPLILQCVSFVVALYIAANMATWTCSWWFMLVWVRKVMCLGDQQTEVKVLAGMGSCWRLPGTHRSAGSSSWLKL